MKKILLFYGLLLISIPKLLAQPAEFNFTPNMHFGGVIATIEIDGIPASGLDWIAVFDEDDNCAGAVQLLENGGQTFCSLLVYGMIIQLVLLMKVSMPGKLLHLDFGRQLQAKFLIIL